MKNAKIGAQMSASRLEIFSVLDQKFRKFVIDDAKIEPPVVAPTPYNMLMILSRCRLMITTSTYWLRGIESAANL